MKANQTNSPGNLPYEGTIRFLKMDMKRCYKCGEWCGDGAQDGHSMECNGDKVRVAWSGLFSRLKNDSNVFNHR